MTRRLSTSRIGIALTIGLRAAAAVAEQNNRRSRAGLPWRTARPAPSFAIVVTALLLAFAVPTAAPAQSCVGTVGPCFQGLGFLDPSASTPLSISMGISPDGTVVVGYSTDANGNYQAFKWSGGTMTGLGYINPSCPSTSFTCYSIATGVNSLGTIVGYSPVAAGNSEAFSWSGGTMTGLGYLDPSFPSSAANAIASQANMPVGYSAPNPSSFPNVTNEAVYFQSGGVVIGLGFLETTNFAYSDAYGVNSNGQVIVGNSHYSSSNQQQEAFIWQNGMMTGLGFLPSSVASDAYAVNASGTVVVGDSATTSDMAVRWVNGTISALTGGVGGGGPARGVSANGNVVVGIGLNGGVANGPFRWTPVDGMQTIANRLTAAGVSFAGWSLANVQTSTAGYAIPGVSADGTTITGVGTDPSGHTQAWIARLPAPGATLAATHDYNGDGYSDIAWRDGSGDLALWLMNGATVSSSGGVSGLPSTLMIVGHRDFNGDGKADLLWRDSSGNTSIWFMNGTTVASTASVGNVPTNWSVAGVGDFNGDGIGDLLWRDTSGDVAVWLMNGATVIASAGLGNVPNAWTLAGVGDFNGDGKADLLWRDMSGDTSIWFMNGTSVASTAAVGNIPTNWMVVGTGDFNGDGMSDIVWRDSVGDTSIWLMNGATVASSGGLGNVPTTWSVVLTGDFNGDGRSDLLWRDNVGDTSMWFMNGTTIASTAAVGNIPTTWTVQAVNAE
jgi:probable HAF family extracellular repeat protein